ncbi:hypothetical protein D9756_003569 [Leucocoprinus leucothites]|uniref:Uncharacterized protein n=1 Tax=Leucocoprinus leucothites TaxID=201217 RepID=A0A8H5G728_9AGAR|nr:hypothetical protein D9756_003569 [Leucoagaricus leucothites]
MSANPNSPPHERQLEADAVADILEQFYLDTSEESGSIEEQEDVCLYNLYENQTPKPNLKSPKPLQNGLLANSPIDHDILTQKLKSYMESTSSGDKIDSRLDVRQEWQGVNVSIKMTEPGRGGTLTPRASGSRGYPCSKN